MSPLLRMMAGQVDRKTKKSKRDGKLKLTGDRFDLPLHAQVRQTLRERALLDFAHDQQFYSERNLIKMLGVSQPTIRRALSDLVSEGYLVADARRGYFVHHHSESRYVGLIQIVWHNDFIGTALGEYFLACRKQDITLLPYGVHQTDTMEDIVQMIRHKPSEERIIIAGLTLEMTNQLGAMLHAKGYHHLLVGPKPAGFTGSSLFRDQNLEVDLVLDYLVGLGHRRIVFVVNEPAELVITNQRAKIIARELKKRGLSECSLIQCNTQNWDNSYDAAYKKIHELLQVKPWPTALVPLSGVGSWAALRCAIERGIKVPDELSIVSFDAIANSDMLPIPMTELTFSAVESAGKAVDLLWSDSPVPVHATMETKLMVRQSSGPPRAGA